ncbi:MAG TPA: hypothetical protein VGL65_07555 [Gemmatimonadales bacterium]
MRRLMLGIAAGMAAGCGHSARELAPIRLETVMTLGADSGAGAIVTVPSVSADHPGGFRIVIPAASAVSASPLVYDDSGHYRGLLSAGTGDQQFQTPLFTRIGPGDSVWIFDASQRAFVFDSNLHFVRSVDLPASPWDAQILSDGRLLIAPANADRPLPLQLLTGNGALVRTIGAADSAVVHAPRWLIPDRDGTFWTMPTQFRWRLEHWDSNGARIGVIERHPAWYPSYARALPTTTSQPPQASILGAWLDADRRLWVLGSTADPQWPTGLGPTHRGERDQVIVDPDKVFDTVIEAIDPASGSALAMTRVDQAFQSVVEPDVIMRAGDARGGWKKAILVRVVLDGGRADASGDGQSPRGNGKVR